ncbi:single-stranded DNA-binding protein [Tersicoccus solisilvae]|uniref:Single-stranded DNA-binding protein n=1 Tax=Tersicoccus solisilvae TaxID=1882339 RepID=A0ABQ1NJW0_9MICC|nr:R3H domain-containing nucleic acid-binding protein [Tersicoccus solisilvae]GGC79009.1 single-stranded DNA-binding protein [Tersicoccus solisilvae]
MNAESVTEPETGTTTDVSAEEGESTAAEATDTTDEQAGPSTRRRLEEEGDVAADYLEELLDIADIDGDIDIEVRAGRTHLSIVSDGDNAPLEALVGRDGAVLDALQELVRLAVLASTDTRSRLVLDINGYRGDRASVLQRMADDAVARVRDTHESVALKPMSAYERKIVHDAIADLGMISESEGEGASRHVVVSQPGQ